MADEQADTESTTEDNSSARDLVEAFKSLVGIGDADAADDNDGQDDDGHEVAAGEPDGLGVGVDAAVGASAGVDGELQGTVGGGGATAAGEVEGALDTGLGGEYDGSAEGEMSVDPGAGSVEGAVDVSIGQEDVLGGRFQAEGKADVQFGPTSFGVGGEASLTQTDPFGIDTAGVGAGGSYHHDVGADGVEAGAALEGTVDSWAGDEYHGEAEADLGFGQGALDVDGSVELSHTAPFGVASESFEAEGTGHVDSSGWDVEGDVGYELDVGGGAPEVAVGGGFSTSGEWSDAEDAANDAGDAAQDAYNSAEDTANDAENGVGDTYESAEDEVESWF
jgi:hypothetical protein